MIGNQRSGATKAIVLGVAGLAIVIAAVFYFGSGYGKVSYPAYQAAYALYGACLGKSEARIESVESLIDNGNEKFDAELISEQERAWLDAVIEKARSGQWETAAAMAKRMMEDQNSSNGG